MLKLYNVRHIFFIMHGSVVVLMCIHLHVFFGTHPCFLNFPNHVIVFRVPKYIFSCWYLQCFLLKHARWCSGKLGRVQRVGVDCDPTRHNPTSYPRLGWFSAAASWRERPKSRLALRASLPWHQAEKFRLLSCLEWLFREYLSFKAS